MVMSPCPSTLVFDPQSQRCRIPCPSPGFSHTEWWALTITMTVLNSISLLVLVSSLIYWRFYNVVRPVTASASFLRSSQNANMEYPRILTFHFMLSLVGFHISFLVAPMLSRSREHVWCLDDGFTNASSSHWQCGVESVLTLYFAWCASLWWAVQLSGIFLRVVRKQTTASVFTRAAPFLCWVLPLVPVVTAWSFGSLDYSPYTANCFLSSNMVSRWAFFYGFASFVATSGVCFTIPVAHSLLSTFRTVHSRQASSSPTQRSQTPIRTPLRMPTPTATTTTTSTTTASFLSTKAFLFECKLALLLFIYLAGLAGFVVYNTISVVREDEYTEALRSWALCELSHHNQTSTAASTLSQSPSPCTISSRPPYHLYLASNCLVALSGVSVALIFSANAEYVWFWRRLFVHMRRRISRGVMFRRDSISTSAFGFFGSDSETSPSLSPARSDFSGKRALGI